MNVHDEILHRLDKIESDHGVRVLFACESGSRAWNFASGDSDYDVRFLYVHRRDWYLGIDTDARRDVIELPIEDELDINGWDLRKALRLLRKSNPPLLEWIGSPIVYREAGALAERLRVLRETFCSPRACAYHYFHMARGNYRDYLKGPEVRLKKYLYVLRPLLGVKWIEAGFGVVPTPFPELVDRLTDGALRDAIDDLLEQKRHGIESDTAPAIPELNAFIERELERIAASELSVPVAQPRTEPLDELFRETLTETWDRA